MSKQETEHQLGNQRCAPSQATTERLGRCPVILATMDTEWTPKATVNLQGGLMSDAGLRMKRASRKAALRVQLREVGKGAYAWCPVFLPASDSHWGKLNRNQKSSSYFKMKPENMQEPLTQCGRMSLTEALFHSSASVPPFPESSLLSRALHVLILYSILRQVSSTPFYK